MKNLKEKLKKINKKYWIFLFIILISLISSIILFDNGILKGHDIEYHLSRIKGIKDNLENGNILALIHNGFNGYGYPNGLFYSNLFLYFPAILNLMGLNIITSYKIFIFFCTILTSFSMFYCVKKITKDDKKSLLASLIYTTSSYRICDVFVRAAIGEVLSFIFLPIIILGLYEIIKGNEKKYYIFSLGFVGLVNCHILTTLFMFLISLLIIIINYKNVLYDKKRFKSLVKSVLLGIGIGAFFIFPFLEQYLPGNLLVNNRDNSIEIIFPFEKIFFGIPNYTTKFIPGGVGLIFFWSLFLRSKIKKQNNEIEFADLCMLIGFASLLFSTNLVPWKELSPILGFMQFTWRLLFISTTFLSIASGIIINEYFNQKENIKLDKFILVFYIIILCLINQGLSYLSIKTYYNNTVQKITDYNSFSIAAGEYLPYNTDWSLIDLDKKECRTNSGDIKIKYERKHGKEFISFTNNLSNDTYIEVPLIYYKGYNLTSLKNRKYYISSGYNTWVRINVGNTKEDKIIVKYTGTKILKLSYIISIFTLIIFLYGQYRIKKES